MIFPFTAVVDQEEMKLGLILNVIDSSIGGVLIMGEKGTAKSTAVRALADLLPEIDVVKGCRFNCSPEGPFCSDCLDKIQQNDFLEFEKKKMRVVELPLGVTEDRLIGSLDIEHAIKKGKNALSQEFLQMQTETFFMLTR